MLKPGYKSQDETLCPICQQPCRSRQGLVGHLMLKHGVKLEPGELDELPRDNPGQEQSIPALKSSIERMALEKKKRELLASEQPAAKPIDLAARAGLGELDNEVKSIIQSRAFNIGEQGQPGVLEGLLRNPAALGELIQLGRTVFGSGNNDTSNLLKQLGYGSLRELFEAARNPRLEAGSSLGGINLSGVQATPELVGILLRGGQEERRLKAEGEDCKARLVFLDEAYQKISGVVGRAVAGGLKGAGTGGGVASHRGKLQPTSPGQEPEKQATTMKCPECGQLLSIDGFEMGDNITCAACRGEFTLLSPDEPMAAEAAAPTDEESQAKLRQGYRWNPKTRRLEWPQ